MRSPAKVVIVRTPGTVVFGDVQGEKVKIILKLFLVGFQKTKKTVLKLQKEIVKTTFSDLSAIKRDSKNKNRDF